jgi:hypothetical protein
MRIVRPGMVVGPQQQYMLENQMKWVSWVSSTTKWHGRALTIQAARDQLLREIAEKANANEPINPLATPPLEPDGLIPSSPSALLPDAVTTAIFRHPCAAECISEAGRCRGSAPQDSQDNQDRGVRRG